MSGNTSWLSQTWPGLCLFLGLTASITGLRAQSSTLPPPEAITDRQGLPQAFVPAIVQDQQGFIWMATLDGLARYDGRQFKVFQPTTDGQPGLSSAGIENLLTDPRGNLWVKTYQGDLDWFDTRQETVVNFSRQPRYQHYAGRDTLESYYPDRRQRLWVWLRHKGLLCFDLNSQQVRQYHHQTGQAGSLAGNTITAVAEDGRGQIWVATTAGLDRLDERTSTFVQYRHPPGDLFPDTPIRVMHRRQNGDLLLVSERQLTLLDHRSGKMHAVALPPPYTQWWKHHLGTDTQGNDYLDWAGQVLRINRSTVAGELTLHTLIGTAPGWRSMGLFVDRSDVLWVGTDATGVRKFNLRATLFASQPYHRSFPIDVLTTELNVPPDQVARLALGTVPYNFRTTIDGAGRLWFTVGSTPFYRLDRQTKQLTAIPFPTRFRETGSDKPALLATDPGGRVWAVHDSLVVWYDERTGRWQRFPFPIRRTTAGAGLRGTARLPPPASPSVTVESPILQVVVDGRALWLMTAARGLYRVDRQTGQIRRYAHQPGDSTSLSSKNLYCMFADPLEANTLWVGTTGGGLCRFEKRSGRCRRFTTKNGLPNNVIYAAIPDRQGHVWIATNRGLCRLDRQTGRTRTYTREDGLSADEFNRFHSLYLPGRPFDPDERVILGGIEGITAFTPGRLQEDTYQPTVELTGLWLNNRPVEPGPHSPLGTRPVQMARHLTLPHDQNFLTVAFAGLQFNNPGRLRYRYRLEGIDRDWTLTDQPQAIYTDLSPGSYTLRLNAANTSGQWSPHVRTLTVTINPPWRASWWAYGLYLALAGGIIVVGGRVYLRQREARQQRLVAQMKEQFFANITHEFRTPLTLILSPVEALLSELKQTRYGERLTLVERNARQLLGLINKLMDLARLDARQMNVTPVQGRPDAVVVHLLERFAEAAASAHIDLIYQPEGTGLYWFDPDKLERIVTNLVANALKFTPGTPAQPGRVTVGLHLNAGLQLTVSDTGIGITPDHLPHLFDRFYQIETGTSPQPTGTGIGLALVKELVDLQQGTITVDSQPGQGTTFRVSLPYQSVQDPGLVDPVAAAAVAAGAPAETATEEPASDNRSAGSPAAESAVLLLVEDNDDMARFISQSLPTTYKVHRAVDGLDGLEQARHLMPDLIISDVMMPRMDGYALCQQLKTDPGTDHIPVILLTAKISLDSRMQGLRLGADEYLDKPFHVAELQLRVRNLLATQRRFREQLRAELHAPVALSKPAHPFLQTLYQTLDQHLDDTAFGVEELAQHANMSRMQLYRKLKALAGLPATDFIREYRLKQSVALLQQGLSVSETAYAVGFDSPSYFGQCFREQFGQPPSRFAAKSTE